MLKTDVLSAVESDVMKIKNQRKKRVVEKQSMELQGNSKEEERNKTAEKKNWDIPWPAHIPYYNMELLALFICAYHV